MRDLTKGYALHRRILLEERREWYEIDTEETDPLRVPRKPGLQKLL